MISCIPVQMYTRIIAITRAVGARVMRILEPVSVDDDARRREHILHIILATSIVFLSIFECTSIWNYFISDIEPSVGISPVIFGVLIMCYIGLLFASRRGYAYASSYVVIVLYGSGVLYGGWLWGMSLPPILIATSLIIVTSSVLIGARNGLISAACMIGALVILGIHERGSLGIPAWHYQMISYTDMIVYVLMFIFISGIVWLSTKEITHSLTRARTSEKSLIHERNTLEERVAEGTRAYISLQEQQMRKLEHDAFFGNVSQGLFHDLMNPLSSISLYTEKIAAKNTCSQEDSAAIQQIVHVSKRMDSFMNNIKQHMRMDQGISCTDTIDSGFEANILKDIFSFTARTRGIRLVFDMSHKYIPAHIHPMYIHRIFLNLISNALDACTDAGQCPEKEHEVHVSIGICEHTDNTVLRVTDTGRGIAPDMLPRVFMQPFTTKSTGTGTGLMTVKHITEHELHGSISISSTENCGTSFTITIPRTPRHTFTTHQT